MPKCTLVVPFDKFHGRILDALGGSGQVVFSSSKSANVSRQYVVPANPNTSLQVAVRNALSQSAAGFKALDKSAADNWNSAASAISRSNILNLDYTLSGVSFYCMVNSYRLLAAVPQSDVVPAASAPVAPSGINAFTVLPGENGLSVQVDCTGMADDALVMVRLSSPNIPNNRKTVPGMLSYPSAATEYCFGQVTSELAEITVDPAFLGYTAGDIARIGVTPLSDGYFPGSLTMFTVTST